MEDALCLNEVWSCSRPLWLDYPLAPSRAHREVSFPVLDMVANRVVQKYQQSSCQQIAAQRNQSHGPEEQHAIQILHENPQMRQEFINRVAAPIANKLFECGLIP